MTIPMQVAVAELTRWGDHWLLRYDDASAVLRDLKGVGYLARLLAEPGREIHVTELAGAGTTDGPLPVLDGAAASSYRRRLADLDAELAELAGHDDHRRAQVEHERTWLEAELRRSAGLGGRIRGSGGTSERARTAVTRSLRYGLARVTAAQPAIGRHLDRTVRTGTWCSYQPDPLAAITWRVAC